jgi:DNA-binding SARP family transcriptional activator
MDTPRDRPRARPDAGAGLLPRDRLRRRLEASLSSGLTLVVAPAGYGKTTLLTGWLESGLQGCPSLYYTLTEADNDPAHHLAGMAIAVRDVLARSLPLTLEPQAPLSYSIDLLFRAATEATQSRWLVVIDDCHLAANPALYQALDTLLGLPVWPVFPVIAGRSAPPVPAVARLRVEGRLVELDEGDLRFTLDETRELLAASGLPVDDGALQRVMERTEGWPAAVELVCQAARRQPSRDVAAIVSRFGDERPLFDYLAGQVLDRRPAADQDFLRRTSLLPYLSAGLCTAFLGIDDAPAVLDRLERDHLFISPVAGRPGRRFRYHTLFQEFLRRCLEHVEGTEAVAAWHRRAAAALLVSVSAARSQERVDDQAAAVEHLLAARDWSGAAQAIEAVADVLDFGSLFRLEPWLERLPREGVAARPRLLVALGRVRERQGRWSEALAALEQAERAARAAGSAQDLQQALRQQAWLHFLQDRHAQALALCQQALALLTRGGTRPATSAGEAREDSAGEPEDTVSPPRALGPDGGFRPAEAAGAAALAEIFKIAANCYANLGQPDLSRECFLEALSLYRSLGDRECEAVILHDMAAYCQVQGLLQEAIETEKTSLRLFEELNSYGVSRPLVILGMAYLQRGELEAARTVLERLLRLADAYQEARARAYALYLLGHLRRAEGDPAAARRLYEEAWIVAGQMEDRFLSFELHRGQARLALDEQDWPEARRQGLAALEVARRPANRQLEGLALAMLGQILDAIGDSRQAEMHYRRALELVQAAGGHVEETGLYLLLAEFCLRERREEEAVLHLTRALALSSAYGYEFLFTRLKPERAVPLLVMALGRECGAAETAEVRRLLVRIGPPAVEPLLGLLAAARREEREPADRQVQVQGAVVTLLGEIGDERAIPALSELRKSRNPGLKAAALEALARIAGAPHPPLTVAALGGFQVRRGGIPIPPEAWQARRKARLLLLYLLAHAPRRVPRDRVMDALWPDLAPESAALALNTTFSDLRHILEPHLGKGQPSHYLLRDEETLAINPEAETWYDAAAFQQAVRARGERAQALELYRGDLLPEEPYVDWVLLERERLRGLYLNALTVWLEEHVHAGAWREGAELARRILDLEPWLEEVWQALMTCLARLGRRSEALQAYQACVRALRDELDAAPSAQTQALYETLNA